MSRDTERNSSRHEKYLRIAQALKNEFPESSSPLPSLNDLAQKFGASKATISKAIQLLEAQGCITKFRGRTFAKVPADRLSELKSSQPSDIGLSRFANRLLESKISRWSETEKRNERLGYTTHRMEDFPTTHWQQCLRLSSRLTERDLLDSDGDPFGYLPLRQAICDYVARARGMTCDADQVLIFSNDQAGLSFIASLFLDEDDFVVVENPGFNDAREAFHCYGARVLPLPVDGSGPVVDRLAYEMHRVKLMYLTPARQDPTGVTLSALRRNAVIEWSRRNSCLVVEDDYDWEFSEAAAAEPALFASAPDVVVYKYNFWRVLFPVVRMGFLIVPSYLVPLARLAKPLNEQQPPLNEQKALSYMLTEGYLEKHIRTFSKALVERKRALISGLRKSFVRTIKILPPGGGLQLRVRFAYADLTLLEKTAAESGIHLMSTTHFYTNSPPQGEYLINFARTDATTLVELVNEWAARLRG